MIQLLSNPSAGGIPKFGSLNLSLCLSVGFKAETLSGRVASDSSHDPLDHMLKVRGVNLVEHLGKVMTSNRMSLTLTCLRRKRRPTHQGGSPQSFYFNEKSQHGVSHSPHMRHGDRSGRGRRPSAGVPASGAAVARAARGPHRGAAALELSGRQRCFGHPREGTEGGGETQRGNHATVPGNDIWEGRIGRWMGKTGRGWG